MDQEIGDAVVFRRNVVDGNLLSYVRVEDVQYWFGERPYVDIEVVSLNVVLLLYTGWDDYACSAQMLSL